MFSTSLYQNSIRVSTIQTGCVTIEFDSSYPFHLSGIINRDEYQKSIQQLNLIGMTLTILGAVLQENSSVTQFPRITGFGIILLFCGSFFSLIGFSVIQHQRTKQLQHIIALESMKYSLRTPIPCCWRLETKMNWCGTTEDGQYRRLIYCIVIDIGRSEIPSGNQPFHPENQHLSETTSLINEETDLPPPYSSLSTKFHC
ncbi:hypothetical protein I4U23_003745 [Adineta vaga]|nr:hypothetical protein I4U23_003745 [Adineta vaga]